MIQKKITIEEFLSMSDDEWLDFSETLSNEDDAFNPESFIDMQGMSIRDVAQKYNLPSSEDVRKYVFDKLSKLQ